MKKGLEIGMETLVIFMLILIGFVFLYPFSKAFAGVLTGAGKSAACTASLFNGKGTAKCPIEIAKIQSERAELDGKSFIERGRRETKVMAKDAIAKLLILCLSKGGGYSSRAFDTDNYFEGESVCLECSHLTIDESVGEIRDFTQYVRDTKAGTISDKTYLDALTKDKEHLAGYMAFGDGMGLAPSYSLFSFAPNKEYAVFFIGLKKGYVPNLWNKAGAAINFDLIGFFKNHDTYFAYIVESNKLGNKLGEDNRKICDRIVN